MKIVDIHEAATRLSELVERAARGERIILTRDGVPTAQVLAAQPAGTAPARRLGFLLGKIHVPADFDRMGEEDIAAQFRNTP